MMTETLLEHSEWGSKAGEVLLGAHGVDGDRGFFDRGLVSHWRSEILAEDDRWESHKMFWIGMPECII